ncbi:hypothetical protein HOLleu_37223 [Holothuria leucospilota]|uniref:Uncharacterized protein n=1 Tax=Holothuria leucospilota TaxID=206669 RepID=A0A9Q1BEC9_HOLLE|nr:hypothetical protein HOLleu_37223 [Holothuria leucospilota]
MLSFLVEVKGHLGSQGSKSKISQEFPRSSHGFTRSQKANYPKNSQDHHLESLAVKMPNFPGIPKIKYEPKIIFQHVKIALDQ